MRADELRAELDAAAGPEQPPSADFVTAFLHRQVAARSRRRWGVVGVAGVLVVALVAGVVVLRSPASPHTVQTPAGPTATTGPTTTTAVPRTDVPVAHLELSSSVITAGWTVPATVVVENDTGATIPISGCNPPFHALLGNSEYQQSYAETLAYCPTTAVIPLGESRYPISVMATYTECVLVPGGADGRPPCSLDGIPALPEGAYLLTVEFGSAREIELPAPTAIEVTTTRCVTLSRSVTVPDVRGESFASATKALARKQLIAVPLEGASTGPGARSAEVVAQQPQAGSTLLQGSCVGLRTR